MELHDWDMTDNINTKEEVYAYLYGALEENDIETLFDIIGAIARSKGMMVIVQELGISRENIYESFPAESNPSFSTVQKVLDILGYKMQIMPKTA